MKGALRWVLGVLLAAILAMGSIVLLADTKWGHRQIIRQIANLNIKSGLKIDIGEIDGSIYGVVRLKGVKLSDPQGIFLESPDIALDWNPSAWWANLLDINSLTAREATLRRLPQLRPGDPDAPILPKFDVHIGKLAIDRLVIAEGVAGKARIGAARGRADITNGRANVALDVDAAEGDRLNFKLVAEPDQNQFDVDATLKAPTGGVFGAILGTQRPLEVTITGDGQWRDWRGQALISLSSLPALELGLTAQSGRYSMIGRASAPPFLSGKFARLTNPEIKVRGIATFKNRRLDGEARLTSDALQLDLDGVADLGNSSFDDLRLNAKLLQPSALFPNMSGSNITLKAILDGPFSTARFEYLLTAPRMGFDQTGFENIDARGRGQLSKSPMRVPVRLTAKRVTGVGDVAGGILANLRADGLLLITPRTLTGDGLKLNSDRLDGKLRLFVDLVTGRYDIGLQGQLQRYAIPGLGIVDVVSDLNAVPGNAGGTRVVGRGKAWVRRLDNSFLAGLSGGLPVLDTGLERGPDGILRLNGLRLTAPGISFSGNGARLRDGSFQISGAGRQTRFGPFTMQLDGQISRPKLDLTFDRPNDGMGLRKVRLMLDPVATGFAWRASGQSRLGPFNGDGVMRLRTGSNATIEFARLDVSGMIARGALNPVGSGFDGSLNIAGSGVNGFLEFTPQGNNQVIDARIAAIDAQLQGPPAFSAKRGSFDGRIIIGPSGLTVDGTTTGQGITLSGLSIARLAANVRMQNGAGTVRGSIAGTRGRAFDLQFSADVAPRLIRVLGGGTIDRRAITLSSPATLTPERDGWRLQPVALAFSGGTARIGGRLGGTAPEVDAELDRVPMAVLDMLYPDLGLAGFASGTLKYWQPDSAPPSGKADLRIRGLSRAGLVLASRPIDVGISAVLSGSTAGARMVAVSGREQLGRAQIRLTSIPAGGDFAQRISTAPMLAQLRYSGAVDTLWRLTGVETFDLSGPVAIGADITGTLAQPQIRGSMRTSSARVESGATGMVLSGVTATGRFNGSQLVLDRFTANAGKDGSVTGKGAFDFAKRETGVVGIAIDMQANRAELLARDDLAATITGPLVIRSDNISGTISGEVLLDRSRYRLGQTNAAAAVPRLRTREINSRPDQPVVRVSPNPWRLDIKARAPNRMMVTGLGIDSEWTADVAIEGSILAPSIAGQANLIRGGYEFAGRRFQLQRGTLRFDGSSPPDPALDIVAQGDTQGLNATIRVAGSGLRPEITFASTPALPQDELLSRLLFGTSITNLSAPEAVQLAAGVAALRDGGNGLNPINAIRNAVGLDRLRILPADINIGARTAVAAGKYLGRRTYVEIITDGQGYSATRAEFQVTRWLSLLSSISTIGRQSASVRISKDY